jgi:hypothetical protein
MLIRIVGSVIGGRLSKYLVLGARSLKENGWVGEDCNSLLGMCLCWCPSDHIGLWCHVYSRSEDSIGMYTRRRAQGMLCRDKKG